MSTQEKGFVGAFLIAIRLAPTFGRGAGSICTNESASESPMLDAERAAIPDRVGSASREGAPYMAPPPTTKKRSRGR